jgi:hypothetical protein
MIHARVGVKDNLRLLAARFFVSFVGPTDGPTVERRVDERKPLIGDSDLSRDQQPIEGEPHRSSRPQAPNVHAE